MLSCLALLHGDPWIVLFLPLAAAVIAFVVSVTVFLLWWRFTALSPFYLSIPFAILVTLLALPALVVDAASDLTAAVLAAFVLSLPLSFLAYAVIPTSGNAVEFGAIFAGGVMNAIVIHALGVLARYFSKSAKDHPPLP